MGSQGPLTPDLSVEANSVSSLGLSSAMKEKEWCYFGFFIWGLARVGVPRNEVPGIYFLIQIRFT